MILLKKVNIHKASHYTQPSGTEIQLLLWEAPEGTHGYPFCVERMVNGKFQEGLYGLPIKSARERFAEWQGFERKIGSKALLS